MIKRVPRGSQRRHLDNRVRVINKEFLLSHGWRRISKRNWVYRGTVYWDHLSHQPNEHGAFTTTEAVKHQKAFNYSGWCDCIKED